MMLLPQVIYWKYIKNLCFYFLIPNTHHHSFSLAMSSHSLLYLITQKKDNLTSSFKLEEHLNKLPEFQKKITSSYNVSTSKYFWNISCFSYPSFNAPVTFTFTKLKEQYSIFIWYYFPSPQPCKTDHQAFSQLTSVGFFERYTN